MSAPSGEAPPTGAGNAPAAPPAAVQIPTVPHGVSGNGVQPAAASAGAAPVPQGQQARAPPPTGGPTGAGVQVPRQPAPPSRDTFNTRSLGVALNSQVKKVCGILPSSLTCPIQSLTDAKAHAASNRNLPSLNSLRSSWNRILQTSILDWAFTQ